MFTEELSVERRAMIYAALAEPARLAVVDLLAFGDVSPSELGAALDLPSNLLAHHLRVLEEAGMIRRTRSEADRRRSYARLVPSAFDLLNPAAGRRTLPAGRVVFVCTRNSARSQLAAALWTRRSPVPTASAGTHPADRVHRRAVTTARRHGLTLDAHRTAQLRDTLRPGDLVVAVCDNAYEELHDEPGQQPPLHWSVPDPVRTDTDDAFESAFTEIAARIDQLNPLVTNSQHTPAGDTPTRRATAPGS
ncbi:MAG TPA: helix-turn-helix domain-containing protein [Streptosporangiaceae bacterium]|jgi:protein-tyrosine-phosphatase